MDHSLFGVCCLKKNKQRISTINYDHLRPVKTVQSDFYTFGKNYMAALLVRFMARIPAGSSAIASIYGYLIKAFYLVQCLDGAPAHYVILSPELIRLCPDSGISRTRRLPGIPCEFLDRNPSMESVVDRDWKFSRRPGESKIFFGRHSRGFPKNRDLMVTDVH